MRRAGGVSIGQVGLQGGFVYPCLAAAYLNFTGSCLSAKEKGSGQ